MIRRNYASYDSLSVPDNIFKHYYIPCLLISKFMSLRN